MSKSTGASGEVAEAQVRWREFDSSALPPVLEGALGCFFEHGYHGTTTRMLAHAAGLSVPGLYHHYESKQAIIVDLMERAMADLLRRSLAALNDAGSSVLTQFEYQIECLVLFHAHEGKLAFLSANEIRSLEAEAREKHIAARDNQQRILDTIVEKGVASGIFRTPYPLEASRAIVTMCTAVAQWYNISGLLSPETVAQHYVRFALDTIGYSASD